VLEGKFSTENCWVFAGATVAVAGLTLAGVVEAAAEACRVNMAAPRTENVEEFVATTVTIVSAATALGAV
jgi:hypothetical protein